MKYVGRSGLNYLYEFTKVFYWLKEISAYWFLAKTRNNVIYLLIVCLGKEFLGRIWAHCEILYFIISCYWVEVSYFKGDFWGFTSNFRLKVQQNKFVRALATIGSHGFSVFPQCLRNISWTALAWACKFSTCLCDGDMSLLKSLHELLHATEYWLEMMEELFTHIAPLVGPCPDFDTNFVFLIVISIKLLNKDLYKYLYLTVSARISLDGIIWSS